MANTQPDSLSSGDEGPLVLIVEDEQPIAEALRFIVEDKGYRTIMGRDGLEGLELAQKHDPYIIITDLMMPRLDGATLIRTVRAAAAQAGRRAPLIVLTSAIDSLSVITSSAPDAFAPKPFDLDQIEQLLDHFVSALYRRQ